MANKDYIQANRQWLAEKAKEEGVISEALPGFRQPSHRLCQRNMTGQANCTLQLQIDIIQMEEKKWKTLSSEYLIRRPWLTARRDKVELPDGRINPEYYVLEYPSWVNVVALTKDGLLIMERQYRHGLGECRYEIPAGVVEEGEEPLEAARRELLEETGYAGGEWQLLMTSSGNASSTNNLNYSFFAKGVEPLGGQSLDKYEDLEVFLMEPAEVLDLMQADQLRQALMIAPLYKAFFNRLV